MDAALMERINNSKSLPTIPAVALEVLRMCRSQDTNVRDIAEVISRDPAMSSRILKLSNSSFFGAPTKATTVSQALVRMGLRNARILALSFSVVNQKPAAESPSTFDHSAFWRSSLITAVVAKTIEDWTRRRSVGEAFTAGLLQDIGILTLNNVLRDEYATVRHEAQQNGRELHEVERQFLDADHAEVAGYMLGMWSIPDCIVLPVAAHHAPESLDADNPEDARMARVLQMADAFMRIFCEGVNADSAQRCCRLCAQYLSWSPQKVMKLIREVAPSVQEAAQMLSVEIPTDVLANAAKAELTGMVENAHSHVAGTAR
ncbi:MAG: HDOD domain-containing protein [Planctomycetes bacterium]|nr:HDOD domain-containing protein [Planctomycetota bacterium]